MRIKEQKINQVEKYQNRQNIIWRVLIYAVPGAGHLWIGFPGIAAFFLMIFFWFILKAFFWDGILKDPLSLYDSDSLLKIILFALIFLGFYFFSLKNGYRKRERLSDYTQIFKVIHSQGSEQKINDGGPKRKG